MNIIGVTCVKNEEDIIEAFVRHNLSYLDKLIVLNHGSTDDTARILSRLAEEGLPLIVEEDLSLGKLQGEKMTRLMLRAVNEHGADWVLLLDADELIRCPRERLPLPGAGDYAACLKVAARTYQVHPTDDHSVINPAERIRHRFEREPLEHAPLEKRRYLLKAIVPRALALSPGACVVQGNHFLVTSNQELAHEFWPGFDYAHFSLRTVGQYTSKIAINTLQHICRSSPREDMDSFYLTHLEELRSDFEGFARRFHQCAPSYLEIARDARPVIIQDPLNYRGGPLRHTSLASDYTRLVSNLIGYAETLACSLAPHASANQNTVNEIAELTRLELHGPDAETVVTRTILSGAGHAQTVRFPLPATLAPSTCNLHLGSLAAIFELRDARWLMEDGGERQPPGDQADAKRFSIRKNACLLHHQRYFTFVKGSETAVIELRPAAPGNRRRVVGLELHLRQETDPARVGARLMHNNNLDHLIAPAERIAELKQKLARRNSLAGALGFQFYRLWRSACRPFKG